mmetsp:Transcript_17634/g.48040  ORF Transcript_17634/g.48040 Transcript_17634/m.48040 type:complete len:215 (-) Transcript_17634:1358-2002(-)
MLRCALQSSRRSPMFVAPSRNMTITTGGPKKFKNQAERWAYIKGANAKMEEYHRAREMMKSGKLKNKSYYNKQDNSVVAKQAAIAVTFLFAFLATPFVGRKIAEDEEFRNKWIPSWYDYTIKPERGWTRDEINSQMMQIEMDVRRRAAAGEFNPEKLEALQKRLEESERFKGGEDLLEKLHDGSESKDSKTEIRAQVWDLPNPALEKGESYNES